jgi:hypothetical protein
MNSFAKFYRKRNMSSDLFFLSWRETKSLRRFVAVFSSSLHITRGECENNNLTSSSHKKKHPCPLPLTYGVNISVPIAGGARLNPITAGARLSPQQAVRISIPFSRLLQSASLEVRCFDCVNKFPSLDLVVVEEIGTGICCCCCLVIL